VYSQAPLKHRKLLITFVIIELRANRGASINQSVSPGGRCFSIPSETIKTAAGEGDSREGEERMEKWQRKRERERERDALSVPEINRSRIIPVLIGGSLVFENIIS